MLSGILLTGFGIFFFKVFTNKEKTIQHYELIESINLHIKGQK